MENALHLQAIIFDIKRMSVNDGPGIRSTVFLKGCPMRCLWCHNPESQHRGIEVSTKKNSPSDCLAETVRAFNARPSSQRSAKAADALAVTHPDEVETIGRIVTVAGVVEEVLEDRAFFERSGGGVTLSGGEPLAQPEFTLALLGALHDAQVHTLLDTCGAAPEDALRATLPLTRLYHYDLKETRPERHLKLTGFPLQPVLDNLAMLAREDADIILRCPVVPTLNDDADHLAAIGRIAESHASIQQVELMPYHDFGLAKYRRLGRHAPFQLAGSPSSKEIESWISIVREHTDKKIIEG